VNGETYYPLPDSHGFVQKGKASWYGKKFQGRPTASGETYNMYLETAAHKTLPLGTYVRVTNLRNGKTVVVRINDRGPFVKGRVIDLSYASAKKVQMIGPGVVDVKVVALGKQVASRRSPAGSRPVLEVSDLNKGPFTVQVGAFSEKQNAVRLANRLKILFDHVTVTATLDENRRTLHRVHVSKSETLGRAGRMEKQLEDMGFTGAFIVRL
jgi:rare lipoprotein A